MKAVVIDGVEYVKKSDIDMGNMYLIRTYSAGVHCGELISRDGKEVKLKNARRLWKWVGAYELSQVAMMGVDSGNKDNKISTPSVELILTEAIEIHKMSEKSINSINEVPEWVK